MLLVTGGLGYIGSHFVVLALQNQQDVLVLDNLSNSSIAVIEQIGRIVDKPFTFIEGDIRDEALLNEIFTKFQISAVVHFAGLKAVGESMQKPLEYFDNNIAGSTALFKAMQAAGVYRLVFSSSATVYGENENHEFVETMPTAIPTNNYGYTKLVVEQILQKLADANKNWSIAILRYFNPIGAHPSGYIGEQPQGVPNNLLPYVAQVAQGLLPVLNIFGDDYPTPDGTAIRDYIHVMDLAAGHINALDYLEQRTGAYIWNLGTGNGFSVLQIIQSFEKATGQQVNYQIAPRREGDIAACWANADKAKQELGWQAKLGIDEMMVDLWRWQKNQKH